MPRYEEVSEKQALISSEISDELNSLISGSLFDLTKHKSTLGDFWFLVISAVQKSEQCHRYWLQQAEDKFRTDYKDKPTVFSGREYTEEFQSSDIPKIIASAEKIKNLSLMAFDFLSKQGADIECVTYFGDTPLSKSLRLETDALTIKLLELGANPNGLITWKSPAFNGSHFESKIESPLTIAASNHLKKFRSIEALLDHGADVNFRVCYLKKDGKKRYTNKAINLVLHRHIAFFEFASLGDWNHHNRVVERVVKKTKFRYIELARIFLFGSLVLP